MDLKFEKLYDMTFPLSEDRAPLYIQGFYRNREAGGIYVNKGYYIDLGTYFNLFSLKKWTAYTTISKLKIKLNLTGKFYIELYGMSLDKSDPKSELSVEEVFMRTDCEDSTEEILDIDKLNLKYEFDLIGIKIVALSDNAIFHGGEYLGSFESEREVKIGITICTFKREKYLLPNLDRLKHLISRNPNINVMVIDNGNTLNEVDTEELQIMHNPNFGGAGGFTRGILEQVSQQRNTHIVLMDDDVVIELSSFDRLYAMLRHLKTDHYNKFFAGAMLILGDPLIQHENTAYLGTPFGHEFNLKEKSFLCQNENLPPHENKYAAWWFCCIPVDVVKEIGYPLPIFIKCDDVEYGIRNKQDIMTMNGVGVWHESLEGKWNPVTDYFATRNYLLMFHYAEGYDKFDFLKECFMQILRRIYHRDGAGMRMLELSLKDLSTGLTGITSVGSDKKFAAVRNYPVTKPMGKNIFLVIASNILLSLMHFIRYDHFDQEYKTFRKEKLSDQKFWRSFLGINNES
ncbi:MAG: glycosyltransferase [Selenomonadaceae bacterium]|nr:glycosyltransferase [Selenomonadaceae bacterium]